VEPFLHAPHTVEEKAVRWAGWGGVVVCSLHVGSRTNQEIVGFEVLASILWDKKPRIPLKYNRRFVGTCSLHVQGVKEISSFELRIHQHIVRQAVSTP
jgi:hypothetical protein